MVAKAINLYLASPLGFSEAGREFMYDQIIPLIKVHNFNVIDPWKLTPKKLIQEVAEMPYSTAKKQKWQEVNHIIGKNNQYALEGASGLIAILDGTDVDSGTAAEIGYMAALGKPILGYRGDFRLASDNEGCQVNLQVEYFIRKSGGTIVDKLNDIPKHLKLFHGR